MVILGELPRTRRHEFVLISVFCLRSTTSAIIVNLPRQGVEIYIYKRQLSDVSDVLKQF